MKNLAAKILLLIISLLLSLAGAEIAVRLLFKAQYDTATINANLANTSIRPLIQLSSNPELLYELKPNLDLLFHESRVLTGADGARVGQHSTSQSAQALRVAVLGDSTAFGWRVNYEDSYPELYRQKLEAISNRPIELRNYAVPGYNSKQELLVFQEKLTSFQPNLLILHYDHNDADPTGQGFPPDFMPPEFGDNPLNSALLKLTIRQIFRLRANTLGAVGDKQPKQAQGYKSNDEAYLEHLQALSELADQTRNRRIPVVVIIFDAFIQAHDNLETDQHYLHLHKPLLAEFAEMGFYSLDLYPLYQAEMRARSWFDLSEWWISKEEPVDAHPGPAGHAYIAEQLIKATLFQPELREALEIDATTAQKFLSKGN